MSLWHRLFYRGWYTIGPEAAALGFKVAVASAICISGKRPQALSDNIAFSSELVLNVINKRRVGAKRGARTHDTRVSSYRWRPVKNQTLRDTCRSGPKNGISFVNYSDVARTCDSSSVTGFMLFSTATAGCMSGANAELSFVVPARCRGSSKGAVVPSISRVLRLWKDNGRSRSMLPL